jgi:hypothetical protein
MRMVKSFADPSAHVVSEIMYGANSLLILEKPVGIGETKESGEDWLFHAANKCIAEGGQDIVSLSDFAQWRFYSDLPGENPLTGSLIECFSNVEEILSKMHDSHFHIPVKAKLTPLSIEVTFRPSSSCLDSVLYLLSMINNLLSEALNELFSLLNQLSIVSKQILTIDESCRNERRMERAIHLWRTYFANRQLTEWLFQRRTGMAIVNSLLQEINLLPFLAKTELPDLTAGQTRQIFILKTVKRKDPFLDQFRLDFVTPESPKWSILDIVSSTGDHINQVRSQLMEFPESDNGLDIQRFISTSSHHDDAHIITESAEILDDIIRGTRLSKRGNPSIYLLQPDKRMDIDQWSVG